MKELLDSLIQDGYFGSLPIAVVYGLGMFAVAFAVLSFFVAPMAGITSWLERRVWGRIQSRVGPNRVGPQGVLQWLADGIKNILKEDIIPADADRRLFAMAPYVVFVGFLLTFVVLPFGKNLIVADLNIGILYVLAVTSIVVVGILMAGWASNNKWSLLGGMRSAAQIVSYEIPAGLAVVTIVLVGGTLSTQGLIEGQGWAPHTWFLFHNPFTFVAFFVYFTAALAEGNRTPFDIPEAESELVAGYCTEYSGMRFLLFFFAEWGNLYVIGAIASILFLGGWQIPHMTSNVALETLLQALVFVTKAYLWVIVAMWVRATLPRVRVDQLMSLCWKYMVPMAFFCLLGTSVWIVLWPEGTPWVSTVLVLATLGILGLFVKKVIRHVRNSRSTLYWKPYI
jgi:NADH-quinone oxidoreductase subunit H